MAVSPEGAGVSRSAREPGVWGCCDPGLQIQKGFLGYLGAEYPGPKKVNLLIMVGLYKPKKDISPKRLTVTFSATKDTLRSLTGFEVICRCTWVSDMGFRLEVEFHLGVPVGRCRGAVALAGFRV